MSSAWLGAASGRPAVELLVTGVGSGERLPIPLGVDDSYAFDDGLARIGWVAVLVGYQLVALTDGNLLRPVRLPDAWSVEPAADPRLALVSRYYGRSREAGEPQTIELLDSTGRTLASLLDPGWGLVGELRTGLVVTRDALVAWDGTRHPLPRAGTPEAVIAGRCVVMVDGSLVNVVDTENSREATCSLPEAFSHLSSPSYDSTASSVAFHLWHRDALRLWNASEVLVATKTGPPRVFQVDFEPHSLVWLDHERLLIVGEGAHCVLETDGGRQSEIAGLPRSACPRIDVSRRFDPEQLRSALRPPWKGAIPDAVRNDLMKQSRERIRTAAIATGLSVDSVLTAASEAVRLRSCLAPKRISVGESHFGGVPDLPRGRSWPTSDGVPMAFLVQVRCDELSAALPERGLPTAGSLVVFAAIDEEALSPVDVHVEVLPPGELRRQSWPRALPKELRYRPSLAVAEPMLSVPDWPALQEIAPVDEGDRFVTMTRLSGPAHQVLGNPRTVQGHPPPRGFQLLLQLDSDALIGATFGDGGSLLIWYRAGAAVTGVIEGCVVEMDSP